MPKIKLRHVVVAEFEVDTSWYPEEFRDDPQKITEYEEKNGDVDSIIDNIVSYKVEVVNE